MDIKLFNSLIQRGVVERFVLDDPTRHRKLSSATDNCHLALTYLALIPIATNDDPFNQVSFCMVIYISIT